VRQGGAAKEKEWKNPEKGTQKARGAAAARCIWKEPADE